MLLDGRAQETGVNRRGSDATMLLIYNAHHGSSAGAIMAALIGGSAPTDRVQNLREYSHGPEGPFDVRGNDNRHFFAWLSAINQLVRACQFQAAASSPCRCS